jgi:hypothetical protein
MYSKSTRSLCLTDAITPIGQEKAIVCICFGEIMFQYANDADLKGGQEKENLSVSKRSGPIEEATKSRLRSLRPDTLASTLALSDRKNGNESDTDLDLHIPSAPRVPQGEFPILEPPLDLSQPPLSKADSRGSPTPPPNSPRSVSPEVVLPCESSPSRPLPVIPMSPYNPLTTPSFRHSPPRLPSDQPWRFPSPSHPLHLTPSDVSFGMVMREQASQSAIDVSPVLIAPRDGKASSFNTPSVVQFGKKDMGRSTTKPTPRRLFISSSLPTPITERLSLDRSGEESPPRRIGSRGTPRTSRVAMFASTRLKMSGVSIGSPSIFGEDPFGNLYGPMMGSGRPFSGRAIATPLSSPNADSPVVRTRRYVSNDNLVKSTLNRELCSKEQTIGLGLLEAFSPKHETADIEDDCEIDSMLMSSPVLRARSAVDLGIEDCNEEGQNSPGLHPPAKKRRKTYYRDV